MKKKFAASFVAMALAMSMPMGALAFAGEGDSEDVQEDTNTAITGTPTPEEEDENKATDLTFGIPADKQGTVGASEIQLVGDIAKEDADGNAVAAPSVTPVDQAAGVAAVEEAYLAAKAEEEGDDFDEAAAQNAWDNAKQAYENTIFDITNAKDEDGDAVNQKIVSFQINGTLKENGKATVTVVANDKLYVGAPITVVILHEDGTVEKQVVALQKNGKFTFSLSKFSYIQAFYTPGATIDGGATIDPIPGDVVNPDEPQNGNINGGDTAAPAADADKNLANLGNDEPEQGKSPKTGC